MNRTARRIPPVFATAIAALALGAAPALAGSDGCSDDCEAENAPAQVVPAVPTPVGPAPATRNQTTAPATQSPIPAVRRSTVRVRPVAVVSRTTPQGAVGAGAGGMADQGPDAGLLGVAAAFSALLALAGARLATGRSRP